MTPQPASPQEHRLRATRRPKAVGTKGESDPRISAGSNPSQSAATSRKGLAPSTWLEVQGGIGEEVDRRWRRRGAD